MIVHHGHRLAYKRSLRTATPTPHLRLDICATMRHSLVCGSYRSTLDIASPLHQPPTGESDSTHYIISLNMLNANKYVIYIIQVASVRPEGVSAWLFQRAKID